MAASHNNATAKYLRKEGSLGLFLIDNLEQYECVHESVDARPEAPPQFKEISVDLPQINEEEAQQDCTMEPLVNSDEIVTGIQTATERISRLRRNVRSVYVRDHAAMLAECEGNEVNHSIEEPISFEEAVNSKDANQWIQAMENEYDSLIKNDTWSLTTLPEGRNLIKNKWIYKVKLRIDGSVDRYKARLVVKGCSQREGVDYSETFSPVARLDSIRLILALAAENDLEMSHIDVKTAFLYGNIEEDIYMDEPQGFETNSGMVCKLQKSLYGLKQAPRAWNACFTNFLKHYGLEPIKSDPCIMIRKDTESTLIIGLYVDDGLICCKDKNTLDDILSNLKSRFDISIMDPQCFLGLQLTRNREDKSIHINQEFYIKKVIERFQMNNANGISTPFDSNLKLSKDGTDDGEDHETIRVPYRQAIGSLMYAMVGCRPDIAYSVNFLAKFSEQPKSSHWNAIKRILRYLIDTKDYGLRYSGSCEYPSELVCYVDSDFAGDIDTRRSTAGYLLMYNGSPLFWKSTRQQTVAMSTTEAEFVAVSLAVRDILWLRQALNELGQEQLGPTEVFVDNQSALKLIANNQIHSRTKHIDVKHMFIREKQANGEIDCIYKNTDEQIADICTKALAKDRYIKLRELMGMVPRLQM